MVELLKSFPPQAEKSFYVKPYNQLPDNLIIRLRQDFVGQSRLLTLPDVALA